MVIGSVVCPRDHVRDVSRAVRALKAKFNYAENFEIKWTKVSPAGAEFYRALLDLFFADDKLSFRGLVIPNKQILRHRDFGQSHDDWYYKMFYLLFRPILRIGEGRSYRAYLDIKDTRGGPKVENLRRYLCAHLGDSDGSTLKNIQIVRSHEIACMQITDLLIGALGYVHRGLATNAGKLAVIESVQANTKLTLKYSTAPGRRKFDIFVWEANAGDISE